MRAQPQKTKKALVVTAIVVATALVGYAATAYNVSLWPFSSTPNTSKETGEPNTVNYDPPTDQEVEDGQNAKKSTYNNLNSDEDGTSNGDTPDSNKTSVGVGIAFADVFESNLEVRAFTNGVVQAGTCTVTVVKDGKTITKTSGAFIDASSTQCEPILIPKSQLSSGTWSVMVTYSSNGAYGVSEKLEVTIP